MSPKSLDDPLLAEQLEADLDATGLAACALGIEITERAVVEGSDETRETLARLRDLASSSPPTTSARGSRRCPR
jgi:EAL domain-containing protein (putative c-di-GMP-specific phosphodiesterase class I)